MLLPGRFFEAASTGSAEPLFSVVEENKISMERLWQLRVQVLGRMQRFRDQAVCLCGAANQFFLEGRLEEAQRDFDRARALGAQHGLFVAECSACMGQPQTPDPEP